MAFGTRFSQDRISLSVCISLHLRRLGAQKSFALREEPVAQLLLSSQYRQFDIHAVVLGSRFFGSRTQRQPQHLWLLWTRSTQHLRHSTGIICALLLPQVLWRLPVSSKMRSLSDAHSMLNSSQWLYFESNYLGSDYLQLLKLLFRDG